MVNNLFNWSNGEVRALFRVKVMLTSSMSIACIRVDTVDIVA